FEAQHLQGALVRDAHERGRAGLGGDLYGPEHGGAPPRPALDEARLHLFEQQERERAALRRRGARDAAERLPALLPEPLLVLVERIDEPGSAAHPFEQRLGALRAKEDGSRPARWVVFERDEILAPRPYRLLHVARRVGEQALEERPEEA